MGSQSGNVTVEIPLAARQHHFQITPETDWFSAIGKSGGTLARTQVEEASHPQSSPSTSTATFTCHYSGCGKRFSRRSKLEEHLNVHTGDRPFHCGYDNCQATYRSRSKLQHHERTHLSSEEQDRMKTFSCDHQGCDKRFWTRQHLDRHREGVHNITITTHSANEDNKAKVWKCTEPNCDEAFTKRKKLREHTWSQHSDRIDQQGSLLPFKCSHADCEKRFPTNSKRKSHYKRQHCSSTYTCALDHGPQSESVLAFPTWSALQSHMKSVHPPTCPYPLCNGKVFKNKENLKLHIRRHQDKEAEMCRNNKDKGQDDEDAENFHLDDDDDDDAEEQSGLHDAIRSFQCDYEADGQCTKKFKSLYAMKTHVRVSHLKERPFECSCGKRYGHRHLLKRHQSRCSHQQSKVDAGDAQQPFEDANEVEVDDDVFRTGGGALPDTFLSASSSSNNNNNKRKRDEDSRQEQMKTSMTELLTGSNYGLPHQTGTRRKMKGKILSCPWDQLSRLDGTPDGTSEQEECEYKFSRIYDLRRHLKAKHFISLEDGEILALLDQQQIEQLPPPRPRKQARPESAAG
ncbi:unnamed protein product [Sympodiomycopsis kandeliae]